MKKTMSKPYKIQKGQSRGRYRKEEAVWVCNRTSLQKHTLKKKKKRKIGERKIRRKTTKIFLYTTDLELRRRRCLMHVSQEEDELASQKQFYFQDQGFVQELGGVTSNSTF